MNLRPPGEVYSELCHSREWTDDIGAIINRDRAAVLRWAASQFDRFADDRNAAAELRLAAERVERGEAR